MQTDSPDAGPHDSAQTAPVGQDGGAAGQDGGAAGPTAPESPPTPPTERKRGLSGATWLLVGGFALSCVLGVVGYSRFVESEKELTQALADMSQRAPTLSVDECVGSILEWRTQCGAMKALCEATVYRLMERCLEGADRSAYCAANAPVASTTAFGYSDCEARNLDRGGRKACAATYRAVDTHCKSTARPASTAAATAPSRLPRK